MSLRWYAFLFGFGSDVLFTIDYRRSISFFCHNAHHDLLTKEYISIHIVQIIIPLRRYLEKIKGCRRPDIFRIRPWARHSRIVSGSAWVFLCRCTGITVRSPPHAPTRSCIFAQQRRVWTSCFACFCAYFQHAL